MKPAVEPTVEDLKLLTPFKHNCIRDCNTALKIYQPSKDNDRVIFYAVQSLSREMHFAPNPPFIFYKIIANLFTEWDNFTEEERITQLLKRLT